LRQRARHDQACHDARVIEGLEPADAGVPFSLGVRFHDEQARDRVGCRRAGAEEQRQADPDGNVRAGGKGCEREGAENAAAAKQRAMPAQAIGQVAPQRRRQTAETHARHDEADVVGIRHVARAAHHERHQDRRDSPSRETNQGVCEIPGLDRLPPACESVRHCCYHLNVMPL
jgi:hypothetical protein